jgi:hypothetical protein
MKRFSVHILFIVLSLSLYSQQEVTLLNGMVYKTREVSIDSSWIRFNYLNGKGVLKEKLYPRDDIFSVKYPGGQESVLYLGNGDTAGFIPPDEMRLVVEGYKTVRYNYNGTKHLIIGGLAGFAAGYTMNSVLFGIAVPPVLAVFSKVFPVGTSRYPQSAYQSDLNYQWGMRRQVKRMRTSRILISSALGVAAGIAAAGISGR